MSKLITSQKEVIFRIESEEYAISVLEVVSIERSQQITAVPKQNKYLLGVIDLRGNIIPIVDLKKVLTGNEAILTDSTRLIIVQVDTQVIGFVVDAATDIIDIPSSAIQKPSLFQSAFIYGIAKLEERMIILLDIPYLVDNVIGDLRIS
ncbi:chemotaxis protein CheW [Brevibacillus sp. SYSU BS000544]|uniref:chemotaxis protein CheW n=1 Tax=Brevibacillus sp. SYSU BS000544 TaxID=3416443 RepID=UPI003CE58464